MSKAGSAAKVKLSSYDDLFGNAEEKTGAKSRLSEPSSRICMSLEIIRSVYWTMKNGRNNGKHQ